MFNKEYIHTGIFPGEFGRKIKHLQEVRHASDYDDFYVISKEETEEQIKDSEEIVAAIGQYLKKLG